MYVQLHIHVRAIAHTCTCNGMDARILVYSHEKQGKRTGKQKEPDASHRTLHYLNTTTITP
jgi:hypothetical protein